MEEIRNLEAKVAEIINGWGSGFTEYLKNNDGWILIPHYSDMERGVFKLIEGARNQGLYLTIYPLRTGYGIEATKDGRGNLHESLEYTEVDSIEKVGEVLVHLFLKAKGIEKKEVLFRKENEY